MQEMAATKTLLSVHGYPYFVSASVQLINHIYRENSATDRHEGTTPHHNWVDTVDEQPKLAAWLKRERINHTFFIDTCNSTMTHGAALLDGEAVQDMVQQALLVYDSMLPANRTKQTDLFYKLMRSYKELV